MLMPSLREPRTDPLWRLTAACDADRRPHRLDLIVGVYRDDTGTSPVFGAVAEAERRLAERSPSKEYLGPAGNRAFTGALTELLLPSDRVRERTLAIQSVAGTGALRLLAELLAETGPDRTVYLGTPAYLNHRTILATAGLRVHEYPMLLADGRPDPDAALEAIATASPGDVLMIQGCCHNPTGTAMPTERWEELARAMLARGVVPFVDQAYFGLGDGLEADLEGMRRMLDLLPEAVVAVSASKAWGLYNERTGCAVVVSDDSTRRAHAYGILETVARAGYSQPPDHGARIVHEILRDPGLYTDWLTELEGMRERLGALRGGLADALAHRTGTTVFEPLREQRGMFLRLPLAEPDMGRLREEHAIHGLPSGRINLAGVPTHRLDHLADAIARVHRVSEQAARPLPVG
ncbi:aromatic amino acid aminotransferase [Nocardiopsis terrae]|uniref:Aspartate aminotransferase/aromatic-amino-acid transaminase n=1 Tax=Nocardiopsis terrae TaxID=372655 RepID=A0ABR9HGG6_9ACTN|nr:aromatic amino acid transaminase [Nocardiopsis terrae]MBE1458124.1 aspartate aminotransferase/aromatic-amino-acid transaminase [Nocardiopsis terrae]GHC82042.1 aromatic amino acid aminotransferase [Nocardiopsis terrae]